MKPRCVNDVLLIKVGEGVVGEGVLTWMHVGLQKPLLVRGDIKIRLSDLVGIVASLVTISIIILFGSYSFYKPLSYTYTDLSDVWHTQLPSVPIRQQKANAHILHVKSHFIDGK